MNQDVNTKEQIIQIALSMFAQKGYGEIGVQDICDAAKITKPTLYYYFGSKEGLFQEIVVVKGNELVVELLKATEYIHDFTLSLTKIFKCVLDFAEKNKDFFEFHYVLTNAPQDSSAYVMYKQVPGAISVLFDDFIQNSCNEIGNMRGKEQLYSLMLQNNVNSVALAFLHNQISNDDKTIYQIVHSFMYGVVS